MESFIDIESLIISTPSAEWVHPNVDTIAALEQADWSEEPHLRSTAPVYRAYLQNQHKQTIYVVFQSDWFNRRESESVSETLMNQTFRLSDAEWEEFMGMIDVVLREDVWFPGDVQFCTQPIYTEICSLLQDGFSVTFLSPDVSIFKDEDGSYGWDS
jgi:hypothetical protein